MAHTSHARSSFRRFGAALGMLTAIAATVAPQGRSPLPTGRSSYRTPTEVSYELERLAATYPDNVVRFELPHRSLLGQRMYALAISHNVKTSVGKPVFLMTGLHHAREWPTVELTLEFVWDILQNDGKDPRITSLLDRVRFLVVPVVNPDGYDMSRSMINENKRKNCRIEPGKVPTWADCADSVNRNAGVDLNRNYGPFWGGLGASVAPGGNWRGESPYSEPEIQNLRDLMASNQVVVALSNHTPDAKVLRVPSAANEPTPADVAPYDSLAQDLGRDLKWQAGPWDPKVAGGVYYVATGTMEENAYYTSGTFAFTFENTPQGPGFHPPYFKVVDQYFGTGVYPGSSARAGFLRLYEAAANTAWHSILKVKAPAGSTLSIQKNFTMETSPVVIADPPQRGGGGGGGGAARDTTPQPPPATRPAQTFPVELTSSLVVPRSASGTPGIAEVEWHVNPSVRPSQHAQDWIPETWKLSCTLSKGAGTRTVEVRVTRGAVASVDMSRCR